MISESDFITLPYTPDMTQMGIKYACQSLSHMDNPIGFHQFNQIRRIVTGRAVELAFKRHLNNAKIPHDILGLKPFSDPDHFDIVIGGRRCRIQSFILSKRKQIRVVRKSPGQLLCAQALVPVKQFTNNYLTDDEVYIFAFLTALIAPNQRKLKQAISAGQPIHMIHVLPQKWSRPQKWGSLGELAIKSNMTSVFKLELGGKNKDHIFATQQMNLNPQTRMAVNQEYAAIHYVSTTNFPDEIIGIHSPTLRETYLIKPDAWSNIWIYGMEIIFVGYITHSQYHQNANRLSEGSRVLKDSYIKTDNFGLPIQDLLPLDELFQRAKLWSRR
jgi:hypothetical protein